MKRSLPTAAEQVTIVALGDSTTAADDWSGQAIEPYPELLPGALATHGIRARVVNAGIAGPAVGVPGAAEPPSGSLGVPVDEDGLARDLGAGI